MLPCALLLTAAAFLFRGARRKPLLSRMFDAYLGCGLEQPIARCLLHSLSSTS